MRRAVEARMVSHSAKSCVLPRGLYSPGPRIDRWSSRRSSSGSRFHLLPFPAPGGVTRRPVTEFGAAQGMFTALIGIARHVAGCALSSRKSRV